MKAFFAFALSWWVVVSWKSALFLWEAEGECIQREGGRVGGNKEEWREGKLGQDVLRERRIYFQ